MTKRNLIGLVITLLLASCSNVSERLSRIGQAPDFSEVEIPISNETYEQNPENIARKEVQTTRVRRSNSLWQTGSKTFFRDSRNWQVGDILSINVQINDKAKFDNKSNQARSGKDNMTLTQLFGKADILAQAFTRKGTAGKQVDTDSIRNHSGSGDISRGESINMKMAAMVSQILPNGNLVIQGRQEVRVNYELREIHIAGIVRPRDITAGNTINSDQIAEARISYGGKGTISDMQQPRVGSQIIDAISPF